MPDMEAMGHGRLPQSNTTTAADLRQMYGDHQDKDEVPFLRARNHPQRQTLRQYLAEMRAAQAQAVTDSTAPNYAWPPLTREALMDHQREMDDLMESFNMPQGPPISFQDDDGASAGCPRYNYCTSAVCQQQSWRQGLQLFEAQTCIQVEQRKNEELKARLELTAEVLKRNAPTPKQSRSQQTRISYVPADASTTPVDQSENMVPQTPKPAKARTVRDDSDIYDATPRNLCIRPKVAESSTVQSPASNVASGDDMDLDDWQVVSPQDRGSPFAESVTTATDAATDIATEAPADLADDTRSECDWAEQIRGLEVVAELRDGRTDGENKNRISDAMAYLMVLEDLRRLQEGHI